MNTFLLQYHFQIDQSNLGLHSIYLAEGMGDKFVTAYYDLMVEIAVSIGANRTRAKKECLEQLEFEIKLANVRHQNIFDDFCFN